MTRKIFVCIRYTSAGTYQEFQAKAITLRLKSLEIITLSGFVYFLTDMLFEQTHLTKPDKLSKFADDR